MTRTRIVRWLSVLLPLVALAMLSTMFLFSRESTTESQIPYAEVDAQAAARENRIVAPEYNGVTSDGAQLTLRAAQATPGGEGGAASDLTLDWLGADGLRADLTAPQGGIEEGLVRLMGGVQMTTSSGWQLQAPQIDAQTDVSVIAADQGVEAQAPFGRITAGRMRLAPDDNNAAILNFSDGVRLMYQP